MEEETHKRKHHKKSKHKDFDDDFVEKQLKFAEKQMERAMAQVKLAEKTSKMGAKLGDITGKLGDDDSGNKGMVISHGKTQIHIQSAENIQVGSQNTMIVMNNKGKKKKFSRRRKSYSSEEEEEVREGGTEPTQMEGPVVDTAENDRLVEEILKSERLATPEDLHLASQNIGADWRRFLRFMGLEDAFLSQLQQEYYIEGIKEVIYQGLLAWKRKYSKEATIGALTSTLKKVGYIGIVTIFKP